MALQTDGVIFDELTGDPGSPVEGQVWFNETTFQLKLYRNGATSVLIDKAAFDAHANSTANPHQTTLEQARTAGSTMLGSFSMGGFAITNLGAGSLGTDAAQRQWVIDQITQKLAGLDWQESVINRLAAPPGTPSSGDRYLIIATASGAWTGKEDQIAQWDGAAWVYTVPNEGATTRVETENLIYTFDGSTWGNIGGAVQHSALLGLTTGDPHTQYQLRSEKGAASGYAALESNSAISDATHGQRGSGTTASPAHVSASAAGPGFMPQSNMVATTNPSTGNDNTQGYAVGSHWVNTVNQSVWIAVSVATGAAVWKESTNTASVLGMKAGQVLAASFSGNPKKATVTFTTPFADANYAVAFKEVTTVSGAHYASGVESQTAASFVLNMGANAITSLVSVGWIATKNGESA